MDSKWCKCDPCLRVELVKIKHLAFPLASILIARAEREALKGSHIIENELGQPVGEHYCGHCMVPFWEWDGGSEMGKIYCCHNCAYVANRGVEKP